MYLNSMHQDMFLILTANVICSLVILNMLTLILKMSGKWMCMIFGSKRLIVRVIKYEWLYKLENCVSGGINVIELS